MIGIAACRAYKHVRILWQVNSEIEHALSQDEMGVVDQENAGDIPSSTNTPVNALCALTGCSRHTLLFYYCHSLSITLFLHGGATD